MIFINGLYKIHLYKLVQNIKRIKLEENQKATSPQEKQTRRTPCYQGATIRRS